MDAFRKIAYIFILLFWLFPLSRFGNARVPANPRRPADIQAGEAINDFLRSIEVAAMPHTFDHDKDGSSDMWLFPLKNLNPDSKTKYITLQEAMTQDKLLLKEHPQVAPRTDNLQTGDYPVVAQFLGSGSYGYRPYYPRGGMLGGGWQSRGFGIGGILGPYSYGASMYRPGSYGRYPGGYHGFSGYSQSNALTDDFAESGMSGSYSDGCIFEDSGDSAQFPDSVRAGQRRVKPGIKMSALCFEQWRLIDESRLRGEPEYFYYAGLASPYIRKNLLLFPMQNNIHKAVSKELKTLGVRSKTRAFIDILQDEDIKAVIDYYLDRAEQIAGDKSISGIVIADKSKILALDVYSSPQLFRKMLPQLMQSAAIGACHRQRRNLRRIRTNDVEDFFTELGRTRKLTRESPRTYKLSTPRFISGVELLVEKRLMDVVHLEAFPR